MQSYTNLAQMPDAHGQEALLAEAGIGSNPGFEVVGFVLFDEPTSDAVAAQQIITWLKQL